MPSQSNRPREVMSTANQIKLANNVDRISQSSILYRQNDSTHLHNWTANPAPSHLYVKYQFSVPLSVVRPLTICPTHHLISAPIYELLCRTTISSIPCFFKVLMFLLLHLEDLSFSHPLHEPMASFLPKYSSAFHANV